MRGRRPHPLPLTAAGRCALESKADAVESALRWAVRPGTVCVLDFLA